MLWLPYSPGKEFLEPIGWRLGQWIFFKIIIFRREVFK
jgi:hypothetical protein